MGQRPWKVYGSHNMEFATAVAVFFLSLEKSNKVHIVHVDKIHKNICYTVNRFKPVYLYIWRRLICILIMTPLCIYMHGVSTFDQWDLPCLLLQRASSVTAKKILNLEEGHGVLKRMIFLAITLPIMEKGDGIWLLYVQVIKDKNEKKPCWW